MLSYKNRLLECDLLPLSYRREMLDVIFLYNFINNLNSCRLTQAIKFHETNRYTRGAHMDDLCIVPKKVHLRSYDYFYSNRICGSWNNLPYDLRNCDLSEAGNNSSFKREAKQHFQNLLITKFDGDNTCTWISKCDCFLCAQV
jgi:hypothetical protein